MVYYKWMEYFKSPAIHRTPLYRAKSAYVGMLARCLNKNGKNPSYASVELRMTREEWLEWSVPEYKKFMASNFGLSPCAARIGDAGHYEIGNIHIISTVQNREDMVMEMQAKPDGTKRCSRCRSVLSTDAFNKSKYRRDGFSTDCRDCTKKYREEKKLEA